MFTDLDVSTAVVESLLGVSILIERSFIKVIEPSGCTEQEKENYREKCQHLLEKIQREILLPIYEAHPGMEKIVIDVSKTD